MHVMYGAGASAVAGKVALAIKAVLAQNRRMEVVTAIYASGTFLMILGTWRRWHNRRWGITLVCVAGALLAHAQISGFLEGCEAQTKFNQQAVCNFIPTP